MHLEFNTYVVWLISSQSCPSPLPFLLQKYFYYFQDFRGFCR